MPKRQRRMVPCGGTSKRTGKNCQNLMPQGSTTCGKCKGRWRPEFTVRQLSQIVPTREVWDEILGRRLPEEFEIDADGTRIVSAREDEQESWYKPTTGLYRGKSSIEIDGEGPDTVELALNTRCQWYGDEETTYWQLTERQAKWLVEELGRRFGWK